MQVKLSQWGIALCLMSTLANADTGDAKQQCFQVRLGGSRHDAELILNHGLTRGFNRLGAPNIPRCEILVTRSDLVFETRYISQASQVSLDRTEFNRIVDKRALEWGKPSHVDFVATLQAGAQSSATVMNGLAICTTVSDVTRKTTVYSSGSCDTIEIDEAALQTLERQYDADFPPLGSLLKRR